MLDAELSVPLPGWLRIGTLGDAAPVINFQPVPEPKRDKTRIHLDLVVDDIEEAIETVHGLGGRSLHQRHEYDEGTVVVMADPEGNEFCMVHYFDLAETPAGLDKAAPAADVNKAAPTLEVDKGAPAADVNKAAPRANIDRPPRTGRS